MSLDAGQETFGGMLVDHITCYVADLAVTTEWLVRGYGLEVYASSPPQARELRSVALGANGIRLLLSRPVVGDHPGAAYVEKHGDGVADIALRVPDARAAFATAVRRGARPVSAPVAHGDVVTATIMGVGDIAHTFVERPAGGDERLLPGLTPADAGPAGPDCGLREVDHFAICVEPGQMDTTVAFYREVLDFEPIFTERIEVNGQVMITNVVQGGTVTFTLITPDPSEVSGHLDSFLKDHGGPGVQHIAFTTDDIVRSVDAIAARGVEFLGTPGVLPAAAGPAHPAAALGGGAGAAEPADRPGPRRAAVPDLRQVRAPPQHPLPGGHRADGCPLLRQRQHQGALPGHRAPAGQGYRR